MKAFIKCSTV